MVHKITIDNKKFNNLFLLNITSWPDAKMLFKVNLNSTKRNNYGNNKFYNYNCGWANAGRII
jgi:hypothetical protein